MCLASDDSGPATSKPTIAFLTLSGFCSWFGSSIVLAVCLVSGRKPAISCGIMSDKSELKAELERKKQRLAQIREEKKRKEEERKKKEADQLKDAALHQDDSDLERKRRDAEALLQSMGITPDVPVVPPPMSPTAKSAGTPSEAGSQDSDGAAGPRPREQSHGWIHSTSTKYMRHKVCFLRPSLSPPGLHKHNTPEPLWCDSGSEL
ncbi:cytoplasmic dynein 1 intermediate chain 2-like isoform X5 [Lates japonicus]|uniref:Cytoplasmic dynein 1 intermediate chain 2-like isoform X5 n=1 Tax=Lates japonicus TaxID=270547 RepID=A0AAD3RFY5_LATJO|nr:cytoplasmic dynein 1 intermediate chain 2-like isoform X5 [Lates japonicus]